MAKKRRNIFDKINTLLFWKDTRVTDGKRYQKCSMVRLHRRDE